VEDILEEIRWPRRNLKGPSNRKSLPLSALELAMAPGEPYALDDLAERTARQASDLLADLATLELNGRISRLPGGRFVRLDESAIGER
jgi:DNA processing protein